MEETTIIKIADNFNKNFLKKFALNSSVTIKQIVIDKINEYSPFKLTYINSNNILQVELTDNLYLCYKLNWEEKPNNIYTLFHLTKIEFLYSVNEKLK